MGTDTELRDMVLAFAREQARKVYDLVKESGNLDFGRVQESLDVGGIEWHISARYWTDDDLIKVEGHPHIQDGSPHIQSLGPFGLLFSSETQEAPEGSFAFTLPAGWL